MRTIDHMPIFQVRHGESEENLDKEKFRDVDPNEVGVTEEGHAQGRRAGVFLNNHFRSAHITRVRMLISPLPRAVITADNMLLGFDKSVDVSVDVLPALRETRFLKRLPDGSPVPAPDGENIFGRGLVGETRRDWLARMKDITHAIEDAAISGKYDAIVTEGHESTSRFWTAIEYLDRTIEQADGFPPFGNAHIWKCQGNRVQSIYPRLGLIAQNLAPAEVQRASVQPVPFRFKPQ